MTAQPWEWSLADLEALIRNEIPESLYLDYKSSGALRKEDRQRLELTKDLSAFANSAGGTIVYGITESQRLPKAFDVGIDTDHISVEWIQNVAYASIHPRINGLRVHSVSLSEQRAIFIVHVPQSQTAHMAEDNRYYKRHDGQNVPMEDYEVRDTMRRAETPDVHLALKFHQVAGNSFESIVTVENRALSPAPFFVATLYLPFDLQQYGIQTGRHSHSWYESGKKQLVYEINGEYAHEDFLSVSLDWLPEHMPLFKGVPREIARTLNLPSRYGRAVLWQVIAPSMRKRGGFLITNEPQVWSEFLEDWREEHE